MLIKPMISEKSMNLIESSFYTFEVSKDATKEQIKKMVAEKFSVTPLSIKMINLPAKRKMQRSRKGYYQTLGTRKAILRLKKGEKIALFEVAPKEQVEVKTAENMDKPKVKKSLLRGTKVKVEKIDKEAEIKKENPRGQEDLKTSHKERKKK